MILIKNGETKEEKEKKEEREKERPAAPQSKWLLSYLQSPCAV